LVFFVAYFRGMVAGRPMVAPPHMRIIPAANEADLSVDPVNPLACCEPEAVVGVIHVRWGECVKSRPEPRKKGIRVYSGVTREKIKGKGEPFQIGGDRFQR
jgi:hypothetical protein